jgi:hypothetical protein
MGFSATISQYSDRSFANFPVKIATNYAQFYKWQMVFLWQKLTCIKRLLVEKVCFEESLASGELILLLAFY